MSDTRDAIASYYPPQAADFRAFEGEGPIARELLGAENWLPETVRTDTVQEDAPQQELADVNTGVEQPKLSRPATVLSVAEAAVARATGPGRLNVRTREDRKDKGVPTNGY